MVANNDYFNYSIAQRKFGNALQKGKNDKKRLNDEVNGYLKVEVNEFVNPNRKLDENAYNHLICL